MSKTRKCAYCKTKQSVDTMVILNLKAFCDFEHAVRYGMEQRAKGLAKVRQKERRERREAKEKLKSRSDCMKEVQTVFNRFIRLRDAGKPCISCGTTKDSIQYHAGHFLTTGARPEHRFNEDNCFKQCSRCNNYLSGNVAEARKEIINRIGIDRVEAMESDHAPKKYSIEELKGLKKHYSEKCKELKNRL